MARTRRRGALLWGSVLLSLWGCGQAPSAVQASPPPASVAGASCPPTPSTLPANQTQSPSVSPSPIQTVVACVGSSPITEATSQHWSAIARAESSPPPGHHRHGGKHRLSTHELIVEVMGFLISGEWVHGEAHDLGIHVSPAKVRRSFNSIRKQQFPRMRDFRVFLKKPSRPSRTCCYASNSISYPSASNVGCSPGIAGRAASSARSHSSSSTSAASGRRSPTAPRDMRCTIVGMCRRSPHNDARAPRDLPGDLPGDLPDLPSRAQSKSATE